MNSQYTLTVLAVAAFVYGLYSLDSWWENRAAGDPRSYWAASAKGWFLVGAAGLAVGMWLVVELARGV